MIRKNTVLVLGAGASTPYGYPLGTRLMQLIVDLTGPDGGVSRLLGESPQVREFHRRLRDSDVNSMDDFLASNPMFGSLGKLCIAAALTVWGPPSDHRPTPDHDWYKYLWSRLYEGALTSGQFRENRLRIVTYNYDTSLDRYLVRVLSNAYPDLAKAGEAEARDFAREVVPMVHVHGSLGESEAIVRPERDRVRFVNLDFFRKVAECLRIVHDDEPSKEYEIAHNWLREAEVVHLLGFGFHATNVRRLDLVTQAGSSKGWHAVGGTCFGLEAAERARAERALQLGGQVLHQFDCLAYLRTRALLE